MLRLLSIDSGGCSRSSRADERSDAVSITRSLTPRRDTSTGGASSRGTPSSSADEEPERDARVRRAGLPRPGERLPRPTRRGGASDRAGCCGPSPSAAAGPSPCSSVGAMSARMPPLRSFAPAKSGWTRWSGTGLGVCAVCGSPVTGSRISSQLPWSAVMASTRSPRAQASAELPEAARPPPAPPSSPRRASRCGPPCPGWRSSPAAKSYFPESMRLHQLGGHLAARSSPASGRRSSRRAGWARGTRSSPGKTTSRPPLKKKVTCAYFSVSAVRNWRQPLLGQHLGEDLLRLLRREGHRQVERLVVLGHADVARRARSPPRSNSLKPGIGERAGQLARAVRAEVEEDHRVAVADACATGVPSPSTITVGGTNSSVTFSA